MPELPEVESVRRALAPHLEGRRFERVEIADPRLTRPLEPKATARRLEGERVVRVDRRGKYLVVGFESGFALLVHLRMTGSLRHVSGGLPRRDPYERAFVTLDDGSDAVYRDVRRFGTWQVVDGDELTEHLAVRLGPEPLERGFTTAFLARRLASRLAPLKAAILDQRTVAGIGNIYADEALWHARLDPRRPAGDLTEEEARALRAGIRSALRAGIQRNGADLGDGVYPGGRMQEAFHAYGRAGEPCDRCGSIMVGTRVAGRGTAFCPRCQAASNSSRRPSRSRARSSV